MRLLSSLCTVPRSIKNLVVYLFVIVHLQTWSVYFPNKRMPRQLFSTNHNMIFLRIECSHQQGIFHTKVNLSLIYKRYRCKIANKQIANSFYSLKFPAVLDTSLVLLSKSSDFHFPCLNGCWEYPQLQLILIYIPTLQLLFSAVVFSS